MDDLMDKIREVLSDEESMKQLSELAESLFSDEDNNDEHKSDPVTEENQANTDESGFDISKFLMVGQLMNSASDDKNSGLLLALKPLLKKERQERVDKAVKILKLLAVWNVLKESGMLEDLF
ncbi:MAG: hypothetical protein NC320_12875 [Clostridium sp.]|nr:hypothetical protein [Clostridium sp.]MCM1548287.1 hypothetical protein [Ruminococcus sp.]